MKSHFCVLGFVVLSYASQLTKRALQRSHEKSQLEKWEDKFLRYGERFDQTSSLVALINKIAVQELSGCAVIILYDVFTENSSDLLLEKLFRAFQIPYIHGQISEQYLLKVPGISEKSDICLGYILFLKDVMRSRSVIGPQSNNKVVLVARSSQWRVYEFLASDEAQHFMNLLVIAKSEKIVPSNIELPYILYTHKLYVDALGSSVHRVITSWRNGSFTTPDLELFPNKIIDGFAGHRFIIALAHQPPYVIKKEIDENNNIQWDGIEVRLINLLARLFNFTTDYREAKDWSSLGSDEAVTAMVKSKRANLGVAGLYTTDGRIKVTDTSHAHSQDCAAFISLTSTALPRYRAIMGPFHWSVWLSLTFTYLLAIFALAFTDKHSLRHLLHRPQEAENMFWYVFGTFTNAFSFAGKDSWSKTDKFATRLLIGFYWIFTIIVTACYTGSIIAFVTLPVYPATVDTPQQLLNNRYQIGTLNKGGWQYWFQNSSDPVTKKLLTDVDLVPDIESGLKNTTKAFFWPYAFMGSRAQLDYIVRTKFTTLNKRSLLHIGSQCFAPFGVSLIYNKNSLYSKVIDFGLLRAVQSGIMIKLKSDVEWNMMRSSTGKLLAVNSFGNRLKTLTIEDRALTLDDTQGMFLLLGIGFLIGGGLLLSEWMGGCFHLCKGRRKGSVKSNYRSHSSLTPREKLDSIQYGSLDKIRIRESIDEEAERSEHNCTVHQRDDDVEEQINKLFSFHDVFGGPYCAGGSVEEEEIEEKLKRSS